MTYNGQDQAVAWYYPASEGGAVIAGTSRHADRVIQLMDFVQQSQGDTLLRYGVEGEHYVLSRGEVVPDPRYVLTREVVDSPSAWQHYAASGLNHWRYQNGAFFVVVEKHCD
jgi:hypothetical protein